MKALLIILALAGCGPVPVQVSKTSQEQTQRQSAEQTQSADQQSAHQSESKQGTNSMPVIIICNQNNSARATCVTPKENGPLGQELDSRIKGAK